MSLNYRYTGKEDTAKWTAADWNTYNALIWASLVVGIGRLNEKSAAAFCRRANALKCLSQEIAPKDIEKFFGLVTNVPTMTGAAWAWQFMANTCEENAAWLKAVQQG